MIRVIRVVKSALFFYCSLTSHTIVEIIMAAERGYLQPGDKAPEFKVHIDSIDTSTQLACLYKQLNKSMTTLHVLG